MTDNTHTPLNDDSIIMMMDPTPITIRKVTARSLSEEEFEAEFSPYKKDSGDLYDFEDVARLDPELVWTIVESGDDEDDNWYAAPGFHVINKMGYVVSDTPWTEDIVLAVYFDASGFEKDLADQDWIVELPGMPVWFSPSNQNKARDFIAFANQTYHSADEKTQRRLDKHMKRLSRSLDRLDAMTATDEEHNDLATAAMDFMKAAMVVVASKARKSERGA